MSQSQLNSSKTPEEEVILFYRHAGLWLAGFSVLLALVMVAASDVRFDPRGSVVLSIMAAAGLLVSRLSWWTRRSPKKADAFGTLGQVWVAGVSCGLISLLGLRLQLPLVDHLLRNSDRMIGIEDIALVDWLSRMPDWLMTAMASAYSQTVPILFLSLAILSILGDRLEVWRATFCFVGTLLSACLLSIATPAKGLSVWASDDIILRLPPQSGRYFWATFDRFHGDAAPSIALGSIDGVVSFPSFHVAMGLIVVAMWRRRPVPRVLAIAWLMLMLVATVPLGGHYVVDLLGGACIWACWFSLSRSAETLTTRESAKSLEPSFATAEA